MLAGHVTATMRILVLVQRRQRLMQLRRRLQMGAADGGCKTDCKRGPYTAAGGVFPRGCWASFHIFPAGGGCGSTAPSESRSGNDFIGWTRPAEDFFLL